MSTSNDKVGSPEDKVTARKALEAAEKAEFMQAVMSLYIPLSMFIACCIFAAGVFMVYYEEPAGWGFIATTVVLGISAFIALFKFQNKFRAKGIIPTRDTIVESNIVDARPDTGSKTMADTHAGPDSATNPEKISALPAGLAGTGQRERDRGSQAGASDTTGDAGQKLAAKVR